MMWSWLVGQMFRRGGDAAMRGGGRWGDVVIERLWRSLRYGCVQLQAVETGSELRAGLARWNGHPEGVRLNSLWQGVGSIYRHAVV